MLLGAFGIAASVGFDVLRHSAWKYAPQTEAELRLLYYSLSFTVILSAIGALVVLLSLLASLFSPAQSKHHSQMLSGIQVVWRVLGAAAAFSAGVVVLLQLPRSLEDPYGAFSPDVLEYGLDLLFWVGVVLIAAAIIMRMGEWRLGISE